MGHQDFEAIAGALERMGLLVGRLVREMRNQGWTAQEICALITQHNPDCQPFAQIVSGMKRFPSEIYAPDWIPSGYRVMEDIVKPIQFQMRDLEWVPFLENLEPFVWGETMRERAKVKLADFSLVEAKYIWEHREEIPTNITIVFTGTLLFDTADSRLKVCIMHCDKGQWFPKYPALNFGWYGHHRLPHFKNV